MHNNPILLQKEVLKKERFVVKIKAKEYEPNFNEEEVENFVKKVERISQIEGAKAECLTMLMAFWTTDPRISDAIEAMPGYEEGNCTPLKKDLIITWGIFEPERGYRKDSLI
ncbi:hypothetical protein O181_103797 [Austropuccinia psidii MF-1]|uniref:Uncharacterized protein n=1 Tax=Austropuccinia psidii MF-1 TaxID=1389203 RepID=A0A9Q3PKT2_9BASI|nr:hypothetical protein [Austropuccinia psidii MF-1]